MNKQINSIYLIYKIYYLLANFFIVFDKIFINDISTRLYVSLFIPIKKIYITVELIEYISISNKIFYQLKSGHHLSIYFKFSSFNFKK